MPSPRPAEGARTIYALVDPRDNTQRYLGQIPAPTQMSLTQAVLKKQPAARAVAGWVRALEEAGHAPAVEVVRDQVPAAEAKRVLQEELTERLAAGVPLLNEQGAAKGRKLRQERVMAQRAADEATAWAEMAHALHTRLGGPLPPSSTTAMRLPEPVKTHIPLLPDIDRDALTFSERWSTREHTDHLEDPLTDAIDALFCELQDLHSYGDKEPRQKLHYRICAIALRRRRTDIAQLEQMIGLVPWCMYAVAPWYRMAQAGRLVDSPAQFIRWLGDTPAARALHLLAGEERQLRLMLEHRHDDRRLNPETCLLATAAAHCHLDIPAPLQDRVRYLLADLLRDPMLTQPMADLLLRLDPQALHALGPDVAPGTDERLELEAGTTARVLADLAAHRAFSGNRQLRQAAWRASGSPPTVDVPDFGGWSGPAVSVMRVVSANLVHAGVLAAPEGQTAAEYVTGVQCLLAPNYDTRQARWLTEETADGRQGPAGRTASS
ncbi:hypothetical protein GCM10023084_77020 [Streptomyces lacrimifluminis]|uniref:Uncharacterized protein n=1 Tax=Streptomyces lacrimifluminis TaxID=1500077 RepID=A0A917P918_9ACTN|nr:hypothetical protein [Streptomyces lacrimifluminis]GGJ67001.1 hypothetical protein GCM10012282_74980 [Streptomyces lacrimifluminis]